MAWYVTHRPDGKIAAAYQYEQPDLNLTLLDDSDPELVAFLNPPPPVPAVISDRQFFHQLAKDGVITTGEALDAVKVGAIPAALSSFLLALPEEQRFDAEMILSGATTFERNHPLTEAVSAAQGMTPEQVDDFFRRAGAL